MDLHRSSACEPSIDGLSSHFVTWFRSLSQTSWWVLNSVCLERTKVMTRVNRYSMLAVFVLICFALNSAAQSTASGTINGRVVDQQGAVIPGAAIVARNVDTGLQRSTTSSSQGDYQISNLPPGVYEVGASSPNFAASRVPRVVIQVGDQRDVNFRLSIGSAQQTVEVTAEAPIVESTKTEISTVVSDQDVARLPASS